jgi:hypothetical protein
MILRLNDNWLNDNRTRLRSSVSNSGSTLLIRDLSLVFSEHTGTESTECDQHDGDLGSEHLHGILLMKMPGPQ